MISSPKGTMIGTIAERAIADNNHTSRKRLTFEDDNEKVTSDDEEFPQQDDEEAVETTNEGELTISTNSSTLQSTIITPNEPTFEGSLIENENEEGRHIFDCSDIWIFPKLQLVCYTPEQ